MERPIYKQGAFWATIGLFLVAVVGVLTLIHVSAGRSLSSLESTLLQVLILAASLSGSFLIGRQSARRAARDLMKPAARSAFRRVLGLYASLGRLSETLQQLRATGGDDDSRLDVIQALVTEQQASVNDAMEDWRDLVPEDVGDVEDRLRSREDAQGEAS